MGAEAKAEAGRGAGDGARGGRLQLHLEVEEGVVVDRLHTIFSLDVDVAARKLGVVLLCARYVCVVCRGGGGGGGWHCVY